MFFQAEHYKTHSQNQLNIQVYDMPERNTQGHIFESQVHYLAKANSGVEQLRLELNQVENTLVNDQISKNKPRKRRYNRKGHWSLQESAKYYLFMRSHLSHFRSSHLRRLEKIFKQMSNYLGTRTANQCRSHHQKQQKKYIRLGVLMSSLYQSTKQHTLLSNQPPFSRLDVRYRQLFSDSDAKQNQNHEPLNLNQNHSLIVYEMPESVKIITYEQYLSLFQRQ